VNDEDEDDGWRTELRDELMALVFACEGDFEGLRPEVLPLLRAARRRGFELREEVRELSQMEGWSEFVDGLFAVLDHS